mmetsp:Transcript_106344/g.184877  ORF Transcript_106344/g.184877 Transcript_106344/m.184877 type:complete len:123 (-) Transcript_106344:36-404(-)
MPGRRKIWALWNGAHMIDWHVSSEKSEDMHQLAETPHPSENHRHSYQPSVAFCPITDSTYQRCGYEVDDIADGILYGHGYCCRSTASRTLQQNARKAITVSEIRHGGSVPQWSRGCTGAGQA